MSAIQSFDTPGNTRRTYDATSAISQQTSKPIQQEEIQEFAEPEGRIEQFDHSQEQLRELSARLQSVREEECSRIAREIHDDLGQALTSLKMDIAWLMRNLNSQSEPALRKKLQEMSDLADTTVQAVRRISTDLRPPVLDDIGLVAAIEWHIQEFERRTNIPCSLICDLEESGLQGEAATAVFRIFQETLTNVVRHAHATKVAVTLQETEEQLILHVRDNGRGITIQELKDPKSIGLLGMRERARSQGGWVKIHAARDRGTDVYVTLPLDSNNTHLIRD